uniref:Secreted protein n=1 Tax=Oryza brachyantha TaxID=4533 RepID=J3LEV9_ORYBR
MKFRMIRFLQFVFCVTHSQGRKHGEMRASRCHVAIPELRTVQREVKKNGADYRITIHSTVKWFSNTPRINSSAMPDHINCEPYILP